ncbi:MAG: ABC transporter substrate-binding protein [Candidatus Atribacteria bacterium]|jgi:iron complex transport system substrate-binding protein|nr:ABC transporter substrate-binding protein [Candidatus Atribacteria bacterium]
MNNRNLFSITLLLIVSLLMGCTTPKGIESPTTSVSTYPVTVESCGEPITFDSAPKRALSFDTNMTEIMLALGLEDRMVGYWISGVPVGNEYQEQVKNIPLISTVTWPPPSLEVVLSFNSDFVFGAWNYNFSEESGVTPEKLATAGIKSYVLTESCIAVGMKPDESLESTYTDILNIGKIFGVETRAEKLVNQMREKIATVQAKIGKVNPPLRGFYYGGGSDAAFTAGKYAMATKLMSAVGTKNIFGDIEDDWIPAAGWEKIIELDPEFIVIDDTPWESAEQRIKTLESLPKLASITAIREKRYIVLPWTYILPGMEMDEGIEALAKALYPELLP